MHALTFLKKPYYIVKGGETVFDIAKMHGEPPAMLIARNDLKELSAGRILFVPKGEWELYTVQAGDSAFSLSLTEEEKALNGVEEVYPTLVIARKKRE